MLALDSSSVERCDELVAAHADVAVDAPDRQHDVVLRERAEPRERVLVVGVDERAVDVEDGDVDGVNFHFDPSGFA